MLLSMFKFVTVMNNVGKNKLCGVNVNEAQIGF